MTSHDHDSPPALRAEALEALLIERGLLYADAVDAVIAQFEERVGPLNGARVVARAWVDPGFRAELLADGTRAWPCWSRRSRAGGAANLSLFPSGP